jgi:gluconate 2-dehydrogenase gamma chain
MTDQEDSASSSPKSSNTSRRTFLKVGAGVVGGIIVGSAVGHLVQPVNAATAATTISTSMSNTSSAMTTTSTSSTNAAPSDVLTELIGYTSLSTKEVAIVEALAETIIPSDSTGPGAKEASVTYFIDRQLASGYGTNDRMYNQGPFLAPNQSGSLTVDGITYPGGTPTFAYNGGFGYQYGLTLKEFWKLGLASMEAYSNSAYGGDFETLSSANMMNVLQDLAAGKPTNFTDGPSPQDFFSEAYNMVWAGFLSDPIYGGNRGMVGWSLIGFNGLNSGDWFGEGHTSMDLMVASTPTRLGPVSIAMFQQLVSGSGTTTSSSSSSSSSASGASSSSSSSGSSSSATMSGSSSSSSSSGGA